MKKHNQKVIGSLLVLVCLDITVRPKIILVVLNYETIKPSPTLLQVWGRVCKDCTFSLCGFLSGSPASCSHCKP